MPKVFISWSGEKSKIVADILNRWLPVVLQSIKPFISTEDLKKGGRWLSDLSQELEKESFGVVCLTPTNLQAPWILFEAGALSKSVGDSHVAPFLVGVKPSELPSPLTQFNAVLADRADFKRLIKSINDRNESDPVSNETIERSVDACWSAIETELLKATEPPSNKERILETDNSGSGYANRFDAILQELLVLNRAQTKALSDPTELLPPDYVASLIRRNRDEDDPLDHPAWRDIMRSTEVLRHALSEVSPEVADALHMLSRGTDFLDGRYNRRSRRRFPPVRRTSSSDILIDRGAEPKTSEE